MRTVRRSFWGIVDAYRVTRVFVNKHELVAVMVILGIVYLLICGISSAAVTHFSIAPR